MVEHETLTTAQHENLNTVQRIAAVDEAIERCAKVAEYEGTIQYSKKRRTKTLGLPRDAYPHEVGKDIAQAIRALKHGGTDD